MSLKSINPATGAVIKEYEELSAEQLEEKIGRAQSAVEKWRVLSFEERGAHMMKLAEVLKSKSREYGAIMSEEMGKPISAAVAEAEKCSWAAEFYAENAAKFLADEHAETDASESYVQYDPLGIVLAVMPWNFPFWQALRAACPALMAGNTMLLKHASNVPHCGIVIEELFKEAGFPEGVFQNLEIRSSAVEAILRDDRVVAATLTGSEYAGGQVAKTCGEEIKPTVLELGGSDPFIVLSDADLDLACEAAVKARFQNNGQSCIAAKRFIVMADRYEEFVEKFGELTAAQVVGDPTKEETQIGPLATGQILEDIVKQVDRSVEMGARVVTGGKKIDGPGYFYEPTVLADVVKGMPLYDEETFGPAAAVIKVESEEEAIKVANDTPFGLGATLWTQDIEKAKCFTKEIFAGAVFINGMVKSDPRLPFGGIKKSGYGRELAQHGIREFVNAKTIWIK